MPRTGGIPSTHLDAKCEYTASSLNSFLCCFSTKASLAVTSTVAACPTLTSTIPPCKTPAARCPISEVKNTSRESSFLDDEGGPKSVGEFVGELRGEVGGV